MLWISRKSKWHATGHTFPQYYEQKNMSKWPGPTFMDIFTASSKLSHPNNSYETCKPYASIPYCGFMSTELIKHCRACTMTNTQHKHPPSLPYQAGPAQNTGRHHRLKYEPPIEDRSAQQTGYKDKTILVGHFKPTPYEISEPLTELIVQKELR